MHDELWQAIDAELARARERGRFRAAMVEAHRVRDIEAEILGAVSPMLKTTDDWRQAYAMISERIDRGYRVADG